MSEVYGRADFRFAALFLLGLLLPAPARAQGGYVSEKHPEIGMNFSRARDYEAVPLQPGEQWLVLFFAEKEAFRERDLKRFRPELRFVWIDHNPEPEPIEAGVSEASDDPPEEQEQAEPPVPITDFESYAKRNLTRWSLGRPSSLKPLSGNASVEYELSFNDRGTPVVGRAFTYSNNERTIAVYGICAIEDERNQVKIWRNMLKKAKFYDREELARIRTLLLAPQVRESRVSYSRQNEAGQGLGSR